MRRLVAANAWLVILLLMGVGCEGNTPLSVDPKPSESVDPMDPLGPVDPMDPMEPQDPTDPVDPATPSPCDAPEPLEVPLRRLTRVEYDNTVRDLLGDNRGLATAGFTPDGTILGFPTPVPVTVSVAENLQGAAETLAATAVQNLDSLLPCNPATTSQDACALAFVESFGLRAYRTPLTSDQVTRIMTVYRTARDEGDDFSGGIRQVISAVIQSPFFLYRLEVGSPNPIEGSDNVVLLNSYEIAGRLSYLLWSSMPDDELFAAAAIDALQTADQIQVQARRMIVDPKARQAVTRFFVQWLDIEHIMDVIKDTEAYPEFDDELREAMLGETEAFIDDLVWGDDPTLNNLLTASHTFVNGRLANFYGIEGVSGPDFVRRDLPPLRARGILGHGSLLATHASPSLSSPVLRGMFVRSRILCQEIPDPPADLMVVPPDPEPGLTTRELYAEHSEDPSCAGCHQLMDPIGFGFEHFDSVGLYRAQEQGKPIDATGELVGTREIDGSFDGLDALSEQLADSEDLRRCVTYQWFRHAFNRRESAASTCSTARMTDALNASGNNVRELMIALTRTDAFRYRHAVDSEEVQ